MRKKKEYPIEFKVDVLDNLRVNQGNISKTAREADIDRGTLIKWESLEDEIREEDRTRHAMVKASGDVENTHEMYLRRIGDIKDHYLKHAEDLFLNFEKQLGAKTYKDRKKLLAGRVEQMIWDGLRAYDPDWAMNMNEADRTAAMDKLFNQLYKLNDEASIIIEYRNSIMVQVGEVIRGEFGEEGLQRVLRKLENAEDAEFKEM